MTDTGYRTVLKKKLLQYVKNWNIQQLETLIDDFKPLENLEPELKALYALFNIRRVTGNQELGEFIREAERVADFLTRLSGAFAPDSTDGGNQLDWDVLEAEMQRHINRLAPGEQTRFNRSCETIADQITLLQEQTSFLKQVGRMWPLRGKNKETPPDAVTALKRLAAITGKPTTRPEEE